MTLRVPISTAGVLQGVLAVSHAEITNKGSTDVSDRVPESIWQHMRARKRFSVICFVKVNKFPTSGYKSVWQYGGDDGPGLVISKIPGANKPGYYAYLKEYSQKRWQRVSGLGIDQPESEEWFLFAAVYRSATSMIEMYMTEDNLNHLVFQEKDVAPQVGSTYGSTDRLILDEDSEYIAEDAEVHIELANLAFFRGAVRQEDIEDYLHRFNPNNEA